MANVGDGPERGAMVNSSSVLTCSARPRLASLLPFTNLAYSTEARKSRRMVPMLTPIMIPVCLPLDRYLSRRGGW